MSENIINKNVYIFALSLLYNVESCRAGSLENTSKKLNLMSQNNYVRYLIDFWAASITGHPLSIDKNNYILGDRKH